MGALLPLASKGRAASTAGGELDSLMFRTDYYPLSPSRARLNFAS
jgi:hypothetical protein